MPAALDAMVAVRASLALQPLRWNAFGVGWETAFSIVGGLIYWCLVKPLVRRSACYFPELRSGQKSAAPTALVVT
jgi:hypothetical protein